MSKPLFGFLRTLVSPWQKSRNRSHSRRKAPANIRRAFLESLEERALLTTVSINGGESSQWVVSDNVITSNGLPTGGAATTGASGSGASIDEGTYGTQGDAFDFSTMVWVNNTQVGGALSTSGNTVNFAPVAIAGLNVNMQYYFAANSATARALVTLQNPTGSSITVPINYATNLGSDSGTVVQTTSNGNTAFTTADRWIITDDSAGGTGGDPANTTVISGPGSPAVTPTSVSQTVFNSSATNGVLANYSITIGAGQTRSLMFFQKMNATTADATSQAPTFFNTNPLPSSDLLSGLTTTQITQIANWTINANAPVAVPDTLTTTENVSDSKNVISNDTDLDAGDKLSLVAGSASITSPTVVTAKVTQSGKQITFDPGTDFDFLAVGESATVVINYTVTDDGNSPLTANGTLTVTVNGVNDAPVAFDDTNTTNENAAVVTNVIQNDKDIDTTDILSLVNSVSITSMTRNSDNAPIPVSTATASKMGKLSVDFNPGTDFDFLATGETATVKIAYTVKDDNSPELTDIGELTITVTGKNDAPVVEAGGPYQVNEGGSVVLSSAGSSDVDGTITLYEWDLDNNGSFETTGASPTFSAAGLDGPTTKTVVLRLTDDAGATAMDTATVNIDNVAPVIVISLSNSSINENGSTTLSGSITDPGTLDTFTLNVNWGDPLSPANTQSFTLGAAPLAPVPDGIDWNPTTRAFTIPHQYLDDNPTATSSDPYTITVGLTDDDGGVGLSPTSTNDIEPNDTRLTAQSIDSFNWTLDFSPDIGDTATNTSTTIPHTTVNGTGNGTFDVFAFTVASAGTVGIFDIDYGMPSFDAYLRLYDNSGAVLFSVDDSSTSNGQGGSYHGYDSYLQYTFAAAGVYYIEVGSCCTGAIPNGGTYLLQVSLQNHPLNSAGLVPPTISVTVNNVLPVALPQSASTTEAAPITPLNVFAGATDVGTLDTLSATAANGTTAQGGVYTIAANGDFTYDPNGAFEYLGDGQIRYDSVEFTVTDDDGGSATQTVTIQINGINEAPVLDLNGSNGAGIDHAAGFTEDGGPVSIVDTDLSITDVDGGATVLATGGTGLLYVVSIFANNSIIQVDPVTGAQTLLTFTGQTVSNARDLAIHPTTGNLFVVDAGRDAIVEFDLASGVASDYVAGGLFSSLWSLEFEADGSLLVTGFGSGVVRVSPALSQTVLVPTSVLSAPVGIGVGSGGEIYVSDEGTGGVYQVDAVTGAVTLIASGIVYGYDLDVTADGQLLVPEAFSAQVVNIDPATGVVTPLATGGVLGSANYFAAPSAGSEAFVTGYSDGHIVLIDTNGNATILSAGDNLNGPLGIVSDGSSTGQTIASATVTISNLLNGVAESLSVDITGTAITANYDSGTGILSLTGVDTIENYQAVLRTTKYNNASQIPNTTARVIEFVVNDGYDDSAVATSVVSITSLPDWDFGDAPNSYGTLLPGGARHFESLGPYLGSTIDFEPDGLPGGNANRDDNLESDDENGVTFSSTVLVSRFNTTITVNASAAGRLDAWIDFNLNGVFELGEKIANGLNVVAGNNMLVVTVPDVTTFGDTYARFRISTLGIASPTGLANDGEVEDYKLSILNLPAGFAQIIDDPEKPGPANPDVLLINGTSISDAIVVRQTGTNQVTVYIAPLVSIGSFPLSAFGRIVIFGREGNDSIAIESPITKPSTIYGDAGNEAISGGLGPDRIIGGDGIDTMAGNAGDDIFVGGLGNDTIAGGTGFDRIIEMVGAATLTNTTVKVGTSTDTYVQIEQVELAGTGGSDVFTITSVAALVLLDAGAGADTLAYTGDGNMVVTDALLTRTSGTLTTTVPLGSIETLRINGGVGADSFDLTNWTKTVIVSGGAGTDAIVAANNVDFTLTDTTLLRTGLPAVSHSTLEAAQLSGGAGNNRFTVGGWTKVATLNGGGGTDTLLVTDNVATTTLTNTLLTRTGRGNITLASFEAADLAGGAANNTINGTTFGGELKIDGGGGNDTLNGGTGPSLLLGGLGNDTLRAGTGRSVMIGGLGLDRLTGGTSDDLLVDGTTAFDADAAALALIMAEWNSASSYALRAAHLTGAAGGLNGGNYLNSTNVTHDTAIDILLGGLGDDLFFAKLTNPNRDSTADKLPGELLN